MGDAGNPTPIRSDRGWERQGWAEEPEAMTASPALGAVVAVRLDPDDARAVRRAASAAGRAQAEFVRRAALRAAAAIDGEPERVEVGPRDSEGAPRPGRSGFKTPS